MDWKKVITSKVKSSKLLYALYYRLGGIGLSVLKMMVHPDDKMILFNCFGGRKYDDSPKAIYEAMRADLRFDGYHIVWAFNNPELYDIDCKKISTSSIKYYVTALKSRIWITNSSIERGLSFKGKHTICFNTWHGTAIKKLGKDLDTNNKAFRSNSKNSTDYMNVQSDYDIQVFSSAFGIPLDSFVKVGLPRNDILANYTESDRQTIRNSLGICRESKVILYAPTFREYAKDQLGRCKIEFPFDVLKWKEKIGDNVVILFRAHYEVTKFLNIPENDNNIFDVSAYPNLNDLIIASDALITDYSSVVFDYAITGKPIFLFTYDYKEYAEKRGLYFDIRDYFTNASNEDDLLQIITTFDNEIESKRVNVFREKYVQYYGDAALKMLDCIDNSLHTSGTVN